jgi:phospholipid/cholesterol/gamma-HCH transport system substrate-binding protein
MAKSETWAETGVGALVLAAAAGFLIYALGNATKGSDAAGYELIGRFGDVGALSTGADVRVSGVKVGAVSKIELDPKAYMAKVHVVINRDVKLPVDSTAKITSSGLLGGQLVAIAPGGSLEDMKPGTEFQNTQGAVDLFGLIGQFVRPQSGATPAPAAEPAAPAPASAKPAAPAAKSADPYPG